MFYMGSNAAFAWIIRLVIWALLSHLMLPFILFLLMWERVASLGNKCRFPRKQSPVTLDRQSLALPRPEHALQDIDRLPSSRPFAFCFLILTAWPSVPPTCSCSHAYRLPSSPLTCSCYQYVFPLDKTVTFDFVT